MRYRSTWFPTREGVLIRVSNREHFQRLLRESAQDASQSSPGGEGEGSSAERPARAVLRRSA